MLSQACQRCWHRKQKCDRNSPECTACVTAGVKCLPRVWGHVIDSDGDEASGGHHIHTRSPIEYLKQRIRYLEDEASRTASEHETPSRSLNGCNQAGSPATTTTVTVPTPTRQTPSILPAANAQSPPRPTSRRNTDAGQSHRVADVMVNEVEYLSLAAMSGGGKNDDAPSQNSVLNQVVKRIATMRGIGTDATTTDVSPATTESSATLSDIEKDIQSLSGKDYSYLVRNFARTFAWSLPIISEAECQSALDTAMRFEAATAPSTSHPTSTTTPATEAEATAIASSVLALGLIMSPAQEILQGPLHKLIDESKQVLPQILTPATTDTIAIQCLVLQTMIALHYPSAGSAWQLHGLALTKAIAAGSHRSDLKPSTADGADETVQRSTSMFWTIYVLDRTLAMTLGRPFGIEDDDITLKPPEPLMPPAARTDLSTLSKALWTWKVHHALLMSRWHRSGDSFNLDVSFASYEYWKMSYREICNRLTRAEEKSTNTTDDNTGNNSRVTHASSTSNRLLSKEEGQLSCRALVHLLNQAVRKLPPEDASLITFKTAVAIELPRIIHVMHDSIDGESLVPGILDGYDAFAAAVGYILCLYDSRQPSAFRLGITQMRTITESIDVVQSIARYFPQIRGFKDVIWALLQSLEAKAAGESLDCVSSAITHCEIPIPNHVARLIRSCAQT